MIRTVLLAVSLFCLAGVASAATAHVLIRVPAGTAQPPELVSLLAKWRQSGQIAGVVLLTQGKPEKPGDRAIFESLTLLEFSSENAAEIWQRDAAPSLPAGLRVRRADALVHGELTPRDSHRSIFLVNTYTPAVARAGYDEFAREYLKPLYEGQRAAKVLARYTMFLERGAVGQADAIAVLEYRDSAAFAASIGIKTEIRAKLTATHSGYAKFDPIKATLRKDVGGTFATHTEVPAVAGARPAR